jgi:RNA polymerase sigma-70 factor (ECF subfamily)
MGAIEAAKLGDWFDAYAAALVLYARQWLSAAAAEDVVQEVFVRLMAQPGEPANVKAWLFLAARNAAIAAARSSARRQRRENEVGQRQFARRESAWFHARPDDLIDAASAEAAMANLTSNQREIVLLRIWGGLTWSEISSLTGTPSSSVFDQYQSALSRVRELLEQSCKTTKK